VFAPLAVVSFSVSPSACFGGHPRAVQRPAVVACMAETPPEPAAAAGYVPDLKGAVQPLVQNSPQDEWTFRHGSGGSALASTRDIGGKVAMLQVQSTAAPPLSVEPSAPAPLAPALAASTPMPQPAASSNAPPEEWTFRHGAGGQALASTNFIDGSVAMMYAQPSAHTPPAVEIASAPPVSAPVAPTPPPSAALEPAIPAEVPMIGGCSGFSGSEMAQGSPQDHWKFRHGAGDQALGMSGDFRHGTPRTRTKEPYSA